MGFFAVLGATAAAAFGLGLAIGATLRSKPSAWLGALTIVPAVIAGVAVAEWATRQPWQWDDDSLGSLPIVMPGVLGAIASLLAWPAGVAAGYLAATTFRRRRSAQH